MVLPWFTVPGFTLSVSLEKEFFSYALIHANKVNAAFGLRYVTPSFDSSMYHSKFSLQIQRSFDYSSVSNMPVIESRTWYGFKFKVHTQSLKIKSPHILSNDNLIEDIFATSTTLFPTQLAFVVSNLETFSKRNCPANMDVRVHYRTSMPSKTEPQRLLQIVANTTNNIFKIGPLKFHQEWPTHVWILDGVIIPNVEAIEQPGITLLNEDAAVNLAQKLSNKIQLLDIC